MMAVLCGGEELYFLHRRWTSGEWLSVTVGSPEARSFCAGDALRILQTHMHLFTSIQLIGLIGDVSRES